MENAQPNRLDELKAAGVVWWNWEEFCWEGRTPDGTVVAMMSDDVSMRAYLVDYPSPEDW